LDTIFSFIRSKLFVGSHLLDVYCKIVKSGHFCAKSPHFYFHNQGRIDKPFLCDIIIKKFHIVRILRGRVKFPTGGDEVVPLLSPRAV
jgi:hypothetical protein